MKKLILLDVDGVLSIERSIISDSLEESPEKRLNSDGETNPTTLSKVSIPNKVSTHRIHTFNPVVISELNSLVTAGNVEIKFLTNWGGAAKSVFSEYVGLRNISNMDEDAKSLGTPDLVKTGKSSVNWYKSQGFIREATVRGREVLFIDDLVNLDLALAWDKLLPDSAGWLKVNPAKGLTMYWVGRIEDWIQGGPVPRKHSVED
jgi:hypothetical protein